MSITKKKILWSFSFLLCFSLPSIFGPITLSSCSKKTNDDSPDENGNEKSFFSDVINNTSYYFSFNKDDYLVSSSFNLKNNYSIEIKYQKNEIEEFQKQQKIFLKFKCLAKFYLKKIGLIFYLPLITKIDGNNNIKWIINDEIKNFQKDLFKYPPIDDTNSKDNDDGTKDIIIEIDKEKLEKINNVKFDIGQSEYEIVFIISIFGKSLSFKNIEELKKQKNDIGAKNANVFLHLKLEKETNK